MQPITCLKSLATAACLVALLAGGYPSTACAGEKADKELNTGSGVKVALVSESDRKKTGEDQHYLRVLIKVPRGLADLAEGLIDGSSKAFEAVKVGSNSFVAWCGAYWSQMNGPPVISPVSHPMANGPYKGRTNLYFTQERRLKTVADR